MSQNHVMVGGVRFELTGIIGGLERGAHLENFHFRLPEDSAEFGIRVSGRLADQRVTLEACKRGDPESCAMIDSNGLRFKFGDAGKAEETPNNKSILLPDLDENDFVWVKTGQTISHVFVRVYRADECHFAFLTLDA